MKKGLGVDRWLFFFVAALVALGITMVLGEPAWRRWRFSNGARRMALVTTNVLLSVLTIS